MTGLYALVAGPALLLVVMAGAMAILWPALVIGGADRRALLPLALRCAALTIGLIAGSLVLSAINAASEILEGFAGAVAAASMLVACPALFVGLLSIAEPWPLRARGALVAGGGGLLVGIVFWWGGGLTGAALSSAGSAAAIAAFLAPLVGAVYVDALARRREFKRYLARRCPACADPLPPNPRMPCSRCRSAKRRLCHRCRRFSDRTPGEACPVCKATLGARCWRCLYPVAGLGTDRCPECGVWAEPAPERAPERAPAGEDATAGTAPD